MHGQDTIEKNSYEIALDHINKNKRLFEGLVTHYFAIENYKQAFNTHKKKSKNKLIKAVFDFR